MPLALWLPNEALKLPLVLLVFELKGAPETMQLRTTTNDMVCVIKGQTFSLSGEDNAALLQMQDVDSTVVG